MNQNKYPALDKKCPTCKFAKNVHVMLNPDLLINVEKDMPRCINITSVNRGNVIFHWMDCSQFEPINK